MKHLKKTALSVFAALGLAAVAVPVVAQQTQMQQGQMMDGGTGMMGGHHGTMGGHGGMGMMTRAAQSHAMAKFDSDGDGTLSPEEMTAGIQAELATYDTDANGALSLDEFAVMHAAHTRPMTVRVFQMHDPDGDAQVTEAEMAAMMQSHMSHQQGRMHGMRKGMVDND
jgi:Ca2+-binding EF-hand superfamily protein